MEPEEKHAQGNYKKFSANAKAKCAERTPNRGLEEQLVDNKKALRNKKTKLMNTDKQLAICTYERRVQERLMPWTRPRIFLQRCRLFPLRDARHCVRLIFLIKTDRERARASALLEHVVCNTKQHVHRCGI